ncbi:MAG: ATP-binding protein [Dehalococcoidia bacterium]|nr:ATP-binding protein [Dehalococcoidia bacterium]
MFGSIRWRTALAFTVLILICITGLSSYLAHFFGENYKDNLRDQLASQAILVKDSASLDFTNGNAADLDTLAKRLGKQIDARITIIAKDGTVLGDSLDDPTVMENHRNRPELIQALAEGKGSSIRHSTTLGYDMMYVAVPVIINGETVGVARVALPLNEIDRSLDHINRTIIWGSLIAAVASILLALQLSKITIDPVKKLTHMAGKMAEGEFEQELPITSSDEVGELAKAFNHMAARIKEMVGLLTAERDRMALILSNMGDGIFLVNCESRISIINQAAQEMLRITEEGVLGRSFIEAVRDYELNDLLQRCLKSGKQQTGMVEISQRKQFIGAIATPLPDKGGCLLLLHDLTEIRRLEAVRRDFVANVSHELRTPIASLKALNETLQDGAIDDPAVAKDFLARMNTEVDRLAQMVQELGELSRIESGQMQIQKRPFDIAEVTRSAAARMETPAVRAGLTLSADIAPNLPQALGDRDRIEQVLINLLHNAIKFTPPGGRIDISARSEGNDIMVSVSDTGAGISTQDLPRIFERFYKVDKARSGGGTGLGLAIAKHIIQAHGGEIWAQSAEGKGSIFSFRLPQASHL